MAEINLRIDSVDLMKMAEIAERLEKIEAEYKAANKRLSKANEKFRQLQYQLKVARQSESVRFKAKMKAFDERVSALEKALELHAGKQAEDFHKMKLKLNKVQSQPADHKLDYCYAKIDQMVSHENKMTAEFEKMRRQMANLKKKVEMLYIGEDMDERI